MNENAVVVSAIAILFVSSPTIKKIINDFYIHILNIYKITLILFSCRVEFDAYILQLKQKQAIESSLKKI